MSWEAEGFALWMKWKWPEELFAQFAQHSDPNCPCTQILYTLALKHSLYRYIGPKVYILFGHMDP